MHRQMMIVEDILVTARPTPEAIQTPNELEQTSMDAVTTKVEPVASSTILSFDLLLRVFVYDEEIEFWLYPPEGVVTSQPVCEANCRILLRRVGSVGESFAGRAPQGVRLADGCVRLGRWTKI